MAVPGSRSDPYGTFSFLLDIDEITVGGFSEVSGLTIETEVETVREGGVNDRVYQLPKGTKYSDITLKRGLTDTFALSDWYEDVISGIVEKKSFSIHLLDGLGARVRSWHVFEAYPKKWTGPALNAGSSAVATESLVISYQYLIIG